MNNQLHKLDTNKTEYYTPDWVWDCLSKFIPKDMVIWEAFRSEDINSCKSAEYLRELGFNVVNPLVDFFKTTFDDVGADVLISNPPFNLKKEILLRLIELDKPFLLILPNIILNTKYFIELCKKNINIQIIILPKRVDFIKQNGGESKSTFHTLVVTYKFNLNNRLIFC